MISKGAVVQGFPEVEVGDITAKDLHVFVKSVRHGVGHEPHGISQRLPRLLEPNHATRDLARSIRFATASRSKILI